MGEKRYIISDASKMLKVESHVLRYWEEELEIKIPRNEMGHRYYTDNHINLLKNVRDLKEQGYGLRTIKMMIGDTEDVKHLPGAAVDNTKMEQFQKIMGSIVSKALEESTESIVTKAISKSTENMSKEVSDSVSEQVLKGVDYIIRMQDEKEEERYRKIDEVIRSKQHKNKREKKNVEKLTRSEKRLRKQAQKANRKAERERKNREKMGKSQKKPAFSTAGK